MLGNVAHNGQLLITYLAPFPTLLFASYRYRRTKASIRQILQLHLSYIVSHPSAIRNHHSIGGTNRAPPGGSVQIQTKSQRELYHHTISVSLHRLHSPYYPRSSARDIDQLRYGKGGLVKLERRLAIQEELADHQEKQEQQKRMTVLGCRRVRLSQKAAIPTLLPLSICNNPRVQVPSDATTRFRAAYIFCNAPK